jgi:hypothetical protein
LTFRISRRRYGLDQGAGAKNRVRMTVLGARRTASFLTGIGEIASCVRRRLA